MINDNPQLDKPYMQLICHPYEHSSSVNTRVTIDVMQKDLSRDDMIEVLENFMKAMGYSFSSKEALCIEAYD
tara:strand:+ start:4568 stop:4783 length:216 start_codon:yes stop_codon:yes gene_type:complete